MGCFKIYQILVWKVQTARASKFREILGQHGLVTLSMISRGIAPKTVLCDEGTYRHEVEGRTLQEGGDYIANQPLNTNNYFM